MLADIGGLHVHSNDNSPKYAVVGPDVAPKEARIDWNLFAGYYYHGNCDS